MPCTNFFQILGILMWKHYRARRNGIIRTVFLYVIWPPALFSMVYYSTPFLKLPEGGGKRLAAFEVAKPLNKNLEAEPSIEFFFNDLRNSTENGFQMKISAARRSQSSSGGSGPRLVLYFPSSPSANHLMEVVGHQLNLSKLMSLPHANMTGYYGLKTRCLAGLKELLDKLSDDAALVEFQGMTSSYNLPSKLNYTIRMKVDFMTHEYKSHDKQNRPHVNYGEVYKTFLNLQWAIDSSYLKLTTKRTLPRTVLVEEIAFRAGKPDLNAVMKIMALDFVIVNTTFVIYILLISELVEDRASGAEELMKMSGVSRELMAFSQALSYVPIGLLFAISGTICSKWSSPPLLVNTSGAFVFCMVFGYLSSIVAFMFACCSLTSKLPNNAMGLSIAFLVGFYIIGGILLQTEIPQEFKTLIILVFPVAPFETLIQELLRAEMLGDGYSLTNMSKSYLNYSGLHYFIFISCQIVLYSAIAWYFGEVIGGAVGVGKPWNFLCKKLFWCKKPVQQAPHILEDEEFKVDPRYFERPPDAAVRGIQIVNVSKVYGKARVVSHVTFDVLEGEITILLGHNGAGKTTLMSIITGLIKANEGQVFISGFDVATHQKKARSNLGLCYQHNVSVARLTLIQQIQFFAMLKGWNRQEARTKAEELVNKLGLETKVNAYSQQLSGGMKRRLQLACALSGNSKVLILDEPTSGLDVENRRELWDILLSLRGEHTILLTTHHMEEADALGDRVAVMHKGQLRCYASPLFLKKSIGTGYRISLTTTGEPQEKTITSFIQSILPNATPVETTYNSITYVVPLKDSELFPDFFTKLEAKRSELNIDFIGVGVSTLEEVFLKVCSDEDTTKIVQQEVGEDVAGPTAPLVIGARQHIRVLKLLLRRHFRFIRNLELCATLIRVILPLFIVCFSTWLLTLHEGASNQGENKMLSMDVDMYENMSGNKVLFKGTSDRRTMRTIRNSYATVKFLHVPIDDDAVFRTSERNITDYNNYLMGIEMNDTNAKVVFTTTVRHAAPVALNLLSNMLAAEHMRRSDGRTITTYNKPLKGPVQLDNARIVTPSTELSFIWWIIFGLLGMLLFLDKQIDLPANESMSGSRQIHVMAGCSPLLHWLAKYMVVTALFIVLIAFPIILIMAILEQNSTVNQPDFLFTILLAMILGCEAVISLSFSLCFTSSKGLILLCVILLNVAGVISAVLTHILVKLVPDSIYTKSLNIFYVTLPINTMFYAMLSTFNVARTNAFCNLNRSKCPKLHSFDYPGFDSVKCCSNQNSVQYFAFDKFSPLKEFIIQIAQITFFTTITILKQKGFFNDCCDLVINRDYKPPPRRFHDNDVENEKTHISKTIALPVSQISEALLLWNIHKRYFRVGCHGGFLTAVAGIDFSVKKGECFGLLGVNGAGKSTTFKIIACETAASRGQVYANKHFLKRINTQYLQSFGYCPQFFGVDEFLTGRENLTMILTMRGFSDDDVRTVADAWIHVIGLEEHSDKKVSGYSGGCKRRITAAWALCGGNAVTLLDEPTAGVDVAARRKVWAAMRTGLNRGQSILITSHSMDEMEALCNRITIMASGELAVLGSAPALRAAHARGYRVVFKISHGHADETKKEADLRAFKEQMQKSFNCEIKDEHKTMINYHLNDTMSYSELFAALESIKKTFADLIEDYSASETTLEEVFLSYAEENKKKTEAQKTKKTTKQNTKKKDRKES